MEANIPDDYVFPREIFDRIVSWKESWLRDGDQARRLKLANSIIGVLPRILRHIRHIENRIGIQKERIASLEQQLAEAQAKVEWHHWSDTSWKQRATFTMWIHFPSGNVKMFYSDDIRVFDWTEKEVVGWCEAVYPPLPTDSPQQQNG